MGEEIVGDREGVYYGWDGCVGCGESESGSCGGFLLMDWGWGSWGWVMVGLGALGLEFGVWLGGLVHMTVVAYIVEKVQQERCLE